MAGKMESINISKASTTTNLFYLFFHGGKAAIFPFLTLFFRLVGLNAQEAGVIIAVKTLTSLIWAPLWARCATTYNRHRMVLVISLFMMIMTYLSFPALYTQLSKPEHCYLVPVNNHSLDLPQLSTEYKSSTVVPNVSILPKNYSTTPTAPTTTGTKSSAPDTTNSHELDEQTQPTMETTSEEMITTQQQSTTFERRLVGGSTFLLKHNVRSDLYDGFMFVLKNLSLDLNDFVRSNLTANELYSLLAFNNKLMNATEEQVAELNTLVKLEAGADSQKEKQRRSADTATKSRDWTSQIRDKLHSFRSSLQSDKLLLFLILLAIVVSGEIFASPVEKVADDSWFDFLNRIDDLERYGQQRFWGSIAFVVVPIIVTVAVDYTPCFLPLNIHHFLLHFYVFAILTGAALIVACCYPVPPPNKGKYMSKIGKGLKIICYDGRGFLFSVTLLLTGMVYASYYNFLFWRIQDLGGRETPMGLCVSIGAFAEIPMLILSGGLVKKIGNSWMVFVSLFILSLRVLYYAFIPEPWAFLPMELTHGMTHTTLWFAILSYDDFNIGAAIDRSIRSILSSFYFGIGFSAGSAISGYIYHTFDSSILFWGCSAVTGGWCLLFVIIQKCLPRKEKVRYIKLLRSDSDNSDDDQDDWLEMALKDH